jgi:hypothetical protein
VSGGRKGVRTGPDTNGTCATCNHLCGKELQNPLHRRFGEFQGRDTRECRAFPAGWFAIPQAPKNVRSLVNSAWALRKCHSVMTPFLPDAQTSLTAMALREASAADGQRSTPLD